MSPQHAQCKGIAVLSRLKWVSQFHGEAGLQKLLVDVPTATREAIERHVLPHGWVPLEFFIDVNEHADRLFGTGDLALCKEMGAWAARENVPRLFKLFYRLGSPSFLFERAPKLWGAHYDTGRLEVTEPTPNEVSMALLEFGAPHRAHCLSVLGWVTATVELSGCTVTSSDEPKCRTRGDDRCVMHVAWR